MTGERTSRSDRELTRAAACQRPADPGAGDADCNSNDGVDQTQDGLFPSELPDVSLASRVERNNPRHTVNDCYAAAGALVAEVEHLRRIAELVPSLGEYLGRMIFPTVGDRM